MALIGKHNINNAGSNEENIVCVMVDKNYHFNNKMVELLSKYYIGEFNLVGYNSYFKTLLSMFIMTRDEIQKFSKKHNWKDFVALAPFDKTWSKDQIILSLKTDNKLSNFEFVTSQILQF